MKKIVVLGGGYAGILTAKKLEKKIKKNKLQNDISVTLIDKNPYHTMLTELHEVAANRVNEESIKMDFKKIFSGRKIDFVLDNISEIDVENNRLKSQEKVYDYDYLVLGSGSKPRYFGVKGAMENSFSLWSFDNSIILKEHVLNMFRKAESETDPMLRREMLTFVVVGGGFSGVEMVGELAEWLPVLLESYHIDKNDVNIMVVDMLDNLLTSMPDKFGNIAYKRLEKMGVQISLNSNVKEVSPNFIVFDKDNQEVKIYSQTVIWFAGIEGSSVLENCEFAKNGQKRIPTNKYLQAEGKDNVFVVGDNILYTVPGEKRPVPQMVENCEASAKFVANNLMADICKKYKKKEYKPKFHGAMACIGGRYGTAYVGTHNKKFGLPSFFAMFSKHFINIIYFISVLGWNKVYGYLQHEILRVRDNRSFVGGHFSNYSPNFWSVPLRVFLGASWLKSGSEKMAKIIADPTHIFLFPVSDAVSSATTAAPAATASPYGVPLPVPEFLSNIVNWSMDVFIEPIAPVFQALMVSGEIIFGILLIFGLFTALAAIGSSAMCMMIYLSGMSNASILWYFFAGISLIGIGGTGQVFALDYYVLPSLKSWWKKRKFVRKWYIYND